MRKECDNLISDKGRERGRLFVPAVTQAYRAILVTSSVKPDSDFIKVFMARSTSASVKLKDRLGFLISGLLGKFFLGGLLF